MVVLRAAWVKSCPAERTEMSAGEILGNRQDVAAIAAEYGVSLALVLAPNQRRVTSQLLVAMDAGVKRVAALESDSHDIALRVVVHTLCLLIDAGAAHDHLTEKS